MALHPASHSTPVDRSGLMVKSLKTYASRAPGGSVFSLRLPLKEDVIVSSVGVNTVLEVSSTMSVRRCNPELGIALKVLPLSLNPSPWSLISKTSISEILVFEVGFEVLEVFSLRLKDE